MNIKWDYIIIGNHMILYCNNSQKFVGKEIWLLMASGTQYRSNDDTREVYEWT